MKPDAYPDELRKYYTKKLDEVMSYRQDVNAYKEYPEVEINSIEDFQELPMVSKDDLVSGEKPEVLLGEVGDNTVSCGATSGTSGNPTICLRTENDLEKFEEMLMKERAGKRRTKTGNLEV